MTLMSKNVIISRRRRQRANTKKKTATKKPVAIALSRFSLLLWVPLVITVENHLPGKLLGALGGHNNNNEATTSASKEEQQQQEQI